MTSKRFYELIDACRPGHEDTDQPELSELAKELSQDPKLQRLFERSQRLDATIQTSFQKVTPPPGLAERLLEAIETAPNEEGEAAPAIAAAESRVEPVKHPSRRSLARWTGVAALTAVAAAIAIWLAMPQPISTPSDREIAEEVDRWNAELDANDRWQTIANIPSQDFPTWQHLDLRGVARWQWVTQGRNACFDFAINDENAAKIEGVTVRLFCMMPKEAMALPASPPAGYPSPNGWHVGAWKANGRVYFLAVRANGDSKRLYSDLVGSAINPA